ncbi:MAG: type IV toxin-antitoxin system AbiEi family antitoxin domain-containing protein [Chlamydiia bacterium]|nr:type IV toxin-antitoxin system AbiEi family antitoxin domain-containing protein [Chlamydiia bacterium]
MNLLFALKTLQEMGVPIVQTRDAACKLQLSNAHTSQVLRRLAQKKHIVHLGKGLWVLDLKVHPFLLLDYVVAPFPCYISLQTALYHHDMIDQIPRILTAVSLARTKRIETPLATISIHHIAPQFFCEYELDPKTHVKIATPEKALLDIFYLKPAKSLWFQSLPEVELPASFNTKKAYALIDKIPSPARRSIVKKQLDVLLRSR